MLVLPDGSNLLVLPTAQPSPVRSTELAERDVGTTSSPSQEVVQRTGPLKIETLESIEIYKGSPIYH